MAKVGVVGNKSFGVNGQLCCKAAVEVGILPGCAALMVGLPDDLWLEVWFGDHQDVKTALVRVLGNQPLNRKCIG